MMDLDLAGKTVLIRQDLNVPVQNGKVTSAVRIDASIPTIQAALDKGAKVLVMSHLGRPTEGEYNEEFSLQPVVDNLNEKLIENSKTAQKELMEHLKSDLEETAHRWGEDAKTKAEKILNAALNASKKAMTETMQENANTSKNEIKIALENAQNSIADISKKGRNAALINMFSSILVVASVVMLFLMK